MTSESPFHSIELVHEIAIDAPIESVYDLVADMTRTGEWSPECVRCVWTKGRPGRIGSRFVGSNLERDEAAGREWRWDMECEVVEVDPPHRFAWTVLTEAWDRDTSVWAFTLTADGGGTLLHQSFRMRRPPTGLQVILDRHERARQREIIAERRARLDHGMTATLRAIKECAERGGRSPAR